MSAALLRAAAVLGLLALGAAPARADEARSPQEIQASFLFNLAKYVEWPDGTFAGDSDPIVIGVIGGREVGDVLSGYAEGMPVNGRPIEVRRLARLEDARRCHLVFVARARASDPRGIARQFRGASTLTVAESGRFAELGGIVGFEMIDGKIRFEVNRLSADRANLKISSRLLRLASAVH